MVHNIKCTGNFLIFAKILTRMIRQNRTNFYLNAAAYHNFICQLLLAYRTVRNKWEMKVVQTHGKTRKVNICARINEWKLCMIRTHPHFLNYVFSSVHMTSSFFNYVERGFHSCKMLSFAQLNSSQIFPAIYSSC